MRAYFFVNSALSGIQKGLQVAHCVAELSLKVSEYEWSSSVDDFISWSGNDKTIIVLEGGFHQNLQEIYTFLKGPNEDSESSAQFHEYLWAAFSEDQKTMNGMMTCVGIMLPRWVYASAKQLREGINFEDLKDELSAWEIELINLLNSCPLAR